MQGEDMADKQKKLSKFEELRRRAQARHADRLDEVTLYDEGDGFDPPIVVKRMSLVEMERASAIARTNPFGSVRIILGADNYQRIVDALGDDADIETIQEIATEAQSALYGPGASDVPGGSPAS